MVAAAWLLPLICSNHERFPDVLLVLLYSIISQHNKMIISEEPFSFAEYLMVLQLYSLVTNLREEEEESLSSCLHQISYIIFLDV